MTRTLTRSLHRVRACLALGALPAVSLACSVSQNEERQLGAEQAAQVDSELPLLRDTAVTRFVAALGRSMASRTSRADLDWRFAVVNTSEVNAFALPGGFVYVNRGLIEQSDSLDELAGVMAHELGHVVHRHSVQQLQQAGKRDVSIVMLCTLTPACRTLGGRIAVQVGADARTAHYSQRDESQADSEAVFITINSGFDPNGLPAFLRKIMERRTGQPTPLEAFFSTHPTDRARIDALDREIAARGPLTGRKLVRDAPDFHAIQARLRAMPPPPPTDTVVAQRSLR